MTDLTTSRSSSGWIVVVFRNRPKLTIEEAEKIADLLREHAKKSIRACFEHLIAPAVPRLGYEPGCEDRSQCWICSSATGSAYAGNREEGQPSELAKVVMQAHYGPNGVLNEGGLPELYLASQEEWPGVPWKRCWTEDHLAAHVFSGVEQADEVARLCYSAPYFKVVASYRDGQGSTYFDRQTALWREKAEKAGGHPGGTLQQDRV